MLRVISLEIKGNKVFKDFDIDFADIQKDAEAPYFSLVIGPNGTGKSLILRIIIEIFRIVSSKQAGIQFYRTFDGQYNLCYEIDRSSFRISNYFLTNSGDSLTVTGDGNPVRFFMNEQEVSVDQVRIPSTIIANSIMLTDKFPVLTDETTFPQYRYLGVRRTPSTAGTQTYVRRTIDLLTQAMEEGKVQERLGELLNFLELEPSLYVSYTPKYKTKFFAGNLRADFFNEFFLKFTEHTRRSEDRKPWGWEYFQKIKDDLTTLKKLADFCNAVSARLENIKGSRTQYFGYELVNTTNILEDFELIGHLSRLDLISYPSITLKRSGGGYELEESSSGEYHFLSTVVALIATVKEDSLILIDEPEISLHPNWQMRYLDFLESIFKNYKSCHFLICTHSHFLVSDLSKKNSSLISLNRKEGHTEAETLGGNTYGLSAEEILYTVFKLKTVRNHFFQLSLTELLSLVSARSTDRQRIQDLLAGIKAIEISKNDPLNVIIAEAEDYLTRI